MRNRMSVVPVRFALAGCLAIGAIGISAGELLAHARLTRAEPAIDGHVAKSPARLRLWFSESPELAFTKLTLSDSARHVYALGKPERGESDLEVRATVATTLHPGRYTVNWRTAASDGHPTCGAFTFVV